MNDQRIEEIRYVMRNADCGSYSSWCILQGHTGKNVFWLSIRTHDLGGTDYNQVCRVTFEEAKFLVANSKRLFGHYVFDPLHHLARWIPKATEADLLEKANAAVDAWDKGPQHMSVEECANWLNDHVYPAIVDLKTIIENYERKQSNVRFSRNADQLSQGSRNQGSR